MSPSGGTCTVGANSTSPKCVCHVFQDLGGEREREKESVWMEDVFGVSSPRIWRFMWGEFFSPVFLGLSASVCDVVVMCFEDFVRGSTSLDFLASRVSKGVLG